MYVGGAGLFNQPLAVTISEEIDLYKTKERKSEIEVVSIVELAKSACAAKFNHSHDTGVFFSPRDAE